MILDWNIDYECEPIGCPDVNIYFDAYVSRPPSSHTVCDAVCYRNTLRSDSSGSTIASNVKPDPIFMINGGNVLAMRNNTDRRPSALTFRTDVAITGLGAGVAAFYYTVIKQLKLPTETTFQHVHAYVLQNQLTHTRYLPVRSAHAFTYSTLSLLVSVDALEKRALNLNHGLLFGYASPWFSLISLCPWGYMPLLGGNKTIREKLLHALSARGFDPQIYGDAWMMTMPSILGFEGINPLTAYFVYKSTAELWIIILEVCYLD